MLKKNIQNIYCPVFFNIGGKLCLVVGGGLVAEQKVKMLMKFDTKIRVISPVISKNLSSLSKKGKIEIIQREYKKGDVDGASLVFAATNKNDINQAIKKDASLSGIPVNVVDDPNLCDFIVPSIIKKESIIIAISTSGTLPSLSKKLRRDIGGLLSSDYAKYARKIGKFRKMLLERVQDKDIRRKILSDISKMDVATIAGMNINKIKKRFMPDIR